MYLMQKRYEKFRKLGKFTEGDIAPEGAPLQETIHSREQTSDKSA